MAGNGEHDGPGYGLLQEVRAYWEALRPAGSLPARASIDPRGLERALENVFLVERIAPGLARFRIAGMHLTELMGMEVRGMPLSALFDPASRERMQGLMEPVFSGPTVVELALEGERGIGRPSLEGRMILLPVLGDDGTCDRALGCLVTAGPVGRTPRRFAIARQVTEVVSAAADSMADVPVAGRPLTGLPGRGTAPSANAKPGLPQPERQHGFAEPAAAFYPRPAADPRRAHLRLIKSDD